MYSNTGPGQNHGQQSQGPYKSVSPQAWDHQGRFSPSDSVDDIIASSSLSDYSLDNGVGRRTPPSKSRANGKPRSQRRPSNRDEFDGPHQFLQRPPPEYIAMQERELPHLPTNLLVQEQDSVLSQVNDRLSQCAFDFVAKYQFPIPLTQDMRPVERPQDREWYVSSSFSNRISPFLSRLVYFSRKGGGCIIGWIPLLEVLPHTHPYHHHHHHSHHPSRYDCDLLLKR